MLPLLFALSLSNDTQANKLDSGVARDCPGLRERE